jgi:hypothetical protein
VESDGGWAPYTAVSIQNYGNDLALLITGKSQELIQRALNCP